MKIRFISMLLLLYFLCGCDKEDRIVTDDNGVVIRRPHLWDTPLSKDGSIPDLSISTPIIYDESNLLVSGERNGQRSILSLGAFDGLVNWEWSDLLGLLNNPTYKDPINIVRKSYYQFGNKLFFNYSTSSYCIDLGTGQTIWKNQIARARNSNNAGIDDLYFSAGSEYDPVDEQKIYWGNINSADNEQLLLKPNYTAVSNPPSNAQGYLNSIRPFKFGNDTYLAFGIENPYTDFTTPTGSGLTELNLYNLTQSKYEYEKIVINPQRETRVIADLFYQSGFLYFQSSNFIHSYDAMTGQELWRVFIGSSPLTSRMILVDNKLISACEDRILYCVDALTGRILWREQNTGTCSELSYLNGVIYYLGGGDGLLHAVDAETGKHLWKISSPDLKHNSDAYFFGVCIAVPGRGQDNGVVIGTTGINAYAYEAIR
ncbi:MAG: PQQ-binding-like beta-propeller repeat protein [Chryseolinea sp.]